MRYQHLAAAASKEQERCTLHQAFGPTLLMLPPQQHWQLSRPFGTWGSERTVLNVRFNVEHQKRVMQAGSQQQPPSPALALIYRHPPALVVLCLQLPPFGAPRPSLHPLVEALQSFLAILLEAVRLLMKTSSSVGSVTRHPRVEPASMHANCLCRSSHHGGCFLTTIKEGEGGLQSTGARTGACLHHLTISW